MRMDSFEPVITAVRQKVVEEFGINPAEILLLRPATIRRTTSGKPKRLALRDDYQDGSIKCLGRS